MLSKPGMVNCINPYDTGAFNFGRCLRTGTYCALEPGLSSDALCQINRGDFYTYIPTTCVLMNISEDSYTPPMCITGSSKGNAPSGGNDTAKLPDIGTDKPGEACGDSYCDGKAGEKETCPQDCIMPPGGQDKPPVVEKPPPSGDKPSATCGDGNCATDPPEKQTCPQDCLI